MSAGPSWYYGTDPYPGLSAFMGSQNYGPPLNSSISSTQGPAVDENPAVIQEFPLQPSTSFVQEFDMDENPAVTQEFPLHPSTSFVQDFDMDENPAVIQGIPLHPSYSSVQGPEVDKKSPVFEGMFSQPSTSPFQEPTFHQSPPVPKETSSQSRSSPVQETTLQPCPFVYKGISDHKIQEYEPYLDVLDASCVCGAGTLIGVFDGTPIYDHHRLIDCIVNPKKPKIIYLKQELFDVLKKMELVTKDASFNYITKISSLMEIWESICRIVSSNSHPCSGVQEFIYLAVSESALLILVQPWEGLQQIIKNTFIEIVENIIPIFQKIKCKPGALKMCQCFLNILRSPWNHAFMPNFINGKHKTFKELMNLVVHEGSTILVHRIKILFDTKQIISASRFANGAIIMYEYFLTKNKNQNIIREADFERIRDIYYTILMMHCKRMSIISIFDNMNPKDPGKKLTRRYHSKIKYLASLPKEELPMNYKITVGICEMGASMIVANSFKDEFGCIEMYPDFCELMCYWTDMVFLLRESGLFSDMKAPFYRKTIDNFIKWAPTSNHLFTIIKIFTDKFGSTLPRTLYVNTYALALAKNIDEKAYCKLHGSKEKSFISLCSLVEGYLKLAEFLDDITSVSRECVLTAFALIPTNDLLVRIEEFAMKCDKPIIEDSINVPGTSSDKTKEKSTSKKHPKKSRKSNNSTNENNKVFKSDNVRMMFVKGVNANSTIHSELKNLQPEPFTEEMINKLINVLREPRIGTLHWNMQWSDMKTICLQYLDNRDVIINRNMLKHDDLKFLNINVAEYNKLAEAIRTNLGIVDNDYLSTDVSDEDNESIKSNSSGEIVSYSLKSSKAKSSAKPKVSKRKKKVDKTEVKKPKMNVIQSQSIVKESKDSTIISSSNSDNPVSSSLEENKKDTEQQNMTRSKRISRRNQNKDTR